MKITLLTPNASANCVGRSFLLARVLERRHEVEIVGPAFGEGIWEPVASERLDWGVVPVRPTLRDALRLREVLGRVRGDVIYAHKPLATSFGLALWKRITDGLPVVLDIDDWDRAFVEQNLRRLRPVPRLRYLVGSALRPHLVHGYWNNRLFDRLTGRADAITVSNRFLERRFGGTVVRHGRDTERFRADRFDRVAIRRRIGLPVDRPVVLFLGTPRPYKGLDDLIDAFAVLPELPAEPLLAIVGLGDDAYSREVERRATETLGDRVRCYGPRPFSELPDRVVSADVAVIPQREDPATQGQMPAKLFDAMALQVPLVATRVSDVSEVVGEGGWVVDPDSPDALARAIARALGDPDEARRRALIARDRCVRLYSFEAMERRLESVFEPFERHAPVERRAFHMR